MDIYFLKKNFYLCLVLFMVSSRIGAQTWMPDNGNGSFTNPLFYDEFSDPDIIRVGDDFYMAGTTMHAFPGLVVSGPYKLLNGPLTPQYNNDATLFEDEDGQTYLYCSGGGLFQAKIDLATGKLTTPIQKFLDKKEPGWPDWMWGGIEVPFVVKKEGTYFMFFSTWTRGYEVGLLKSKTPLGPWELVTPEPIFGTRKKGYRPEMAKSGGYDHLKFSDTQDPYQETGHNALFIGPDGNLWSSCHYFMYEKRPYPYSQTFEAWEKVPQMGYEPVYYEKGRFYIKGPSWTEQIVQY